MQPIAIYPSGFRPSAPRDLIRIGAKFDGGYVLPERLLAATRGLLSFGLCDEWTFEAEFARRSGARVVCFDPSVDRMFWLGKLLAGLGYGVARLDPAKIRRGFRGIDYARFFDGKHHRHIKAAIGKGVNAVSLPRALEMAGLDEPIFLKMDIEGWEYRILDDVIATRAKFTGLAIEFHDVDLHEDRILAFIRAIADHHVLVHFHANSHTTVLEGGRALVIELSFMNRALMAPGEALEHHSLPIAGLDAPNLPHNIDAPVAFNEAA
jgi:Methyltransferase FkbM domain